MWNKFSLRSRIYIILAALILITLVGGLVLVWYTYQMEGLLTAITQEDLAAFQAAADLEVALVNQKGFVSYYFMDEDPGWLSQLGKYRQIFQERLQEARRQAGNGPDRNAIAEIENEYRLYIDKKDQVIALYQAGKRESGTKLHNEVRRHFFRVLELSGKYKNLHQQGILKAKETSHVQAAKLRIMAGLAMVASFLLALLLAFVLANQILRPVRRITAAVGGEEAREHEDEVKALSRSVRGLMEDVDHTQTELAKSRESLLQAEKLALVGKLAAGMAHGIRNPFTSVKMRLFSLGRSLKLSDTQKEDFDVISEEIRHIDTIVQNFLEFSRPPRLKMQPISPSVVVDQVLQLLKHRLKSYDVSIRVEREHILPEIEADPEQLKEVLVNLVVNACEAMVGGGTVVIHEYEIIRSCGDRIAFIRVEDSGPGIPQSIREKLFQPFFTTKEDGTGLGLSIAARIVEEHRGQIEVDSEEGRGAKFTVSLPVKESNHE